MAKAVSFTYDNDRSVGSYQTKGGMVSVTTEFGTKSAAIGGSPPLVIARMLARELMQAAKFT
ncbi:hypothetical protein [Bradyrhizobium sp. Leo170]|uniref:hypothetical protein n=1 Tax=Bradyrhizobium sp. Leo170 TaxID=1571199 RepID=UPI00102E862D|nr:hypothetical protein [Bradyrhizobium sp. Leo170]TAI63465.1 hypothetical protein CWO89_24155 [Bradyrhizobium sp. Leo170]